MKNFIIKISLGVGSGLIVTAGLRFIGVPLYETGLFSGILLTNSIWAYDLYSRKS